jgi:hypothetical protein
LRHNKIFNLKKSKIYKYIKAKMFAYMTKAYNYLANAVKFLDDSKDPFEGGDLIEVREIVEYAQPKIKTRPKAIESGKYAKQKGEKVLEWRKRVIPRYNEVKNVNYNINSKFYTTAKLNGFIKEIEEIEGFEEDTIASKLITRKETTCNRCGVDFKFVSMYERHMIRKKSCIRDN